MMKTEWEFEVAYLNMQGNLIHLAYGSEGVVLDELCKEIGYYFVLYEQSRRVVTYHHNGDELKKVKQPKFVYHQITEWKEAVFN